MNRASAGNSLESPGQGSDPGADAVIVGAKDASYWSGKNISGSAIKFTHVNSAKDGGTVAPKGAK
jgi:hypothetical protein